MTAARLRRTARFAPAAAATIPELRPRDARELIRTLRGGQLAWPLRPTGAATSSTACTDTPAGTRLSIARLDRVVRIDSDGMTVTAQAGIRLYALAEALAEQGLELAGSYEMTGRTLGGAIAAPCYGPGIGDDARCLSAGVVALSLVTAAGDIVSVDASRRKLLATICGSYGLLGTIVEATLQVRPLRNFSINHRRLDYDTFCGVIDKLAASDVGLKFCLLPHRDRAYVDLRRSDAGADETGNAAWRLKDWGESTVLPHVFASLNRVLPMKSVRYQIIDSVSAAAEEFVNGRLIRRGSNASAAIGSRSVGRTRPLLSSTWVFPAADIAMIVRAYRDFCRSTLLESNYRCDLPALGYRLARDRSSVLAPSFDEPMVAIRTSTTQTRGWDDFVIDLADFGENWGGTPLFHQTRAVRADYAKQTYSTRLDYFRRMRRQLDPDNRLLSPFMAQYFA